MVEEVSFVMGQSADLFKKIISQSDAFFDLVSSFHHFELVSIGNAIAYNF